MKVVHVDSYPVFRQGMRYLLRQLSDNIIFFEADTLAQVCQLAQTHRPALILIDLDKLDQARHGELETLCAVNPAVPVVTLAAQANDAQVAQLMAAGVAGYVPKSAPCQTLINALRLVLDGGTYAPRPSRRCGTTAQKNVLSQLTRRQLEVLKLMSEGLSNKSIARKLFVTEATVKGHVTAILNALCVNNRVQAVNRLRLDGQPVLH